MAFQDMIYSFQSMGVFDVLLPFILIFTIVFAVLNKSKIFGDRNKQVAVIVALVMGLGTVWPHVMGVYPPDRDIVNIINQSLPNVSVVVIAIVMALIIIGVMGGNWELAGGSISGWVATIAFGIVIYIFGGAANWWHTPSWLYFVNDPDVMALIITVLVFAMIIWFITKEDGSPKMSEKIGDAMKELGKHASGK